MKSNKAKNSDVNNKLSSKYLILSFKRDNSIKIPNHFWRFRNRIPNVALTLAINVANSMIGFFSVAE